MRTKLLTFLMVLLAAVMPASAYDFMVNGLCYNYNNDGTSVTLTYQQIFTPCYVNLSGSVTIPSNVTYGGKTYTVTAISDHTFCECTGLTSVTIPNTVTSIGEIAFYGCTSLTSVTIGKAVTSIKYDAFYGCSKLATVNWNAASCDDFAEYGNHSPFQGFTSIKTFTFGNTVTRIPRGLCRNLTGLTSVTIPASVKEIAGVAFQGCTGLTMVNISDLAAWCDIDFEYSNSNPLYYAQNLYLNGFQQLEHIHSYC